ncbi:MAG: FkbM family methyltransferase [Proteobacteria bacterium]|nr:FkbM family methyltransferase [Pseudomonadota bacterium]
MQLIRKIHTIFSLLEHFGSLKAFITWPKFSLTSYLMVSGLAKQGILPKTVLDVGANVGQFAVASAKIFPHVQIYSFEPLPECYKKLQKNAVDSGNIKVYPLALGDCENELNFHVNSYNLSSSILPLGKSHLEAFPKVKETDTILVKVTTLDRVFTDIELHSPVLLKLDVQGYEANVIRGGVDTLRRIDYVVIEVSFKQMYEGELLFNDITQMMKEHGFQFNRPLCWLSMDRTDEIIQMDALYTRELK